jgi:hypothetical protein
MTAIPFTCIYCLRTAPIVAPSDAHIFPDALGGKTSVSNTVCRECNGRINREIEMPVLPTFALFRSILGIRGRRNGIVRVRASIKFAGQEVESSLNAVGQPDVIIHVGTDAAGRKTYSLFGPADTVEAKRQEIAQKYPDLKWEERDLLGAAPPESLVEFEVDMTGLLLRRLAAKIAFERFAQLRGATFVSDKEFDTIRAFILDGKECRLRCGVLSDPRLLEGPLNFPVPNHSIFVIAHPYDRILGAFVSLYGIFYWWVILSTEYSALGPTDNLLLEHPQNKTAYSPQLRVKTGSVRVPWHELASFYRENPKGSVRSAMIHAVKKFQGAVNSFYDSPEHT